MAGPPREVYLNDPNEADQKDPLTEIEWPIS
jgi:effector-binding domain-containing protein